jgi:cell division protein FtsN
VNDYKPHASLGKRSSSGGRTLIGVFIGLVLGLAIAAAVAVYMTNAPVPFLTKSEPRRPAPQADRNLADAAKSAEAKSGPPEKPRFDFYKMLPGQEQPVTEREIRAAAKKPADPAQPKDAYFVQAGSFQNPADADNLKARLALIGLQASVEPAALPDKGTWYRVRLGPYAQLDDINRVRQALAQNGVDASLIKVKN